MLNNCIPPDLYPKVSLLYSCYLLEINKSVIFCNTYSVITLDIYIIISPVCVPFIYLFIHFYFAVFELGFLCVSLAFLEL